MSRVPFLRGPRVLSFDIFGSALEPTVLEPYDVHRLVASYLRDDFATDTLGGCSERDYPAVRRLAELRAHDAVADDGSPTRIVGMPAVREQLAGLFGADGSRIAGAAIRREIQLHNQLWRANPAALALYNNAIASGATVAFLADSPLPRDLVARILQRAGFRQGLVLVSSQEGVTKTSGAMYSRLARRVGEEVSRIAHVGPDPVADHQRAVEAGIRPLSVIDDRAAVLPRIVRGLVDRTGVDALALALAADRMAGLDQAPALPDVGYYAGGPLATGFGAWTGRLIDRTAPDHVFFCGPSSRLLSEVVSILRPDVPASRLHELDGVDDAPDPARPSGLPERLSVRDGDRVLAVGLGWDDQPHRWLGDELAAQGTTAEVSGAYLGMLDPPPTDEPVTLWAMDGNDECPFTDSVRERIDVVAALLSGSPAGVADADLPLDAGHPRHQLAAGVVEYTNDAAPWFAKLPDDTSPALVEPAVRLATEPSPREIRLLEAAGAVLAVDQPIDSDDRQPINRWRRTPPAMLRSQRQDEGRRR